MKSHTLFAFLIWSIGLLAQNDSSRFFAGVVFSPDYCYRTLVLNDTNDIQFIIDGRNEREIPKFGFTTGISGIWKLNRHVELSAGALYSKKGYATKKIDLEDIFIGSNLKYIWHKYNYHCIDVPVNVHFLAGKKRLQFVSSLGLTGNIFLKETVTGLYEATDGKTDRKTSKSNDDYRHFWLTAEAGIGVKYDLNTRFQLRFVPCFRYGLTKIIDTPVTAYLWSAGCNVSCYYRL